MKKKIIVISDTHRYIENACGAIESFGEIDTIIHLGDMVSDAKKLKMKYPNKKIYYVSGNNDFDYNTPYEQMISFNGKKILITHGHRQRINYNFLDILLWGKEKEADAILFGHTHQVFFENDMGITLFNPGSISLPRNAKNPTFGILTVSEYGKIDCEAYEYGTNGQILKIL